MAFKERYLAGEVEFEEIDRYINQWGSSDDEQRLALSPGLNGDGKDVWVDDGDRALKEMLDRQKS